MAQFPIVTEEGLYEAVNYLAAGPAGLGQNFEGFSAYKPAYMTGTFRAPFTVSTATASPPTWYVAPIAISTITTVQVNTATSSTQFIQINFTPQSTIPFGQGDTVIIEGVRSADSGMSESTSTYTLSGTKPVLASTSTFTNITPIVTVGSGTGTVFKSITLKPTGATTYKSTNTTILITTEGTGFKSGDQLKVLGTSIGGATPANDLTITLNTVTSFYNDTYSRSVLTCSTSSVILQTQGSYTWPAYVSSGTIQKNNALGPVSSDANARVTVQGPTQLVFISSQLTLDFTYTCTTASTFDVVVQINRYRGSIDTSQAGAVDYLFEYDATISEQSHSYSTTSSGSASAGQNIFTTVLDQPSFGYYWYIAEVVFTSKTGNAKPGTFTVGLRSLTAQVIKQ
jgi:hypothetical protein